MIRPGASKCHACHALTPNSEMIPVRSTNGKRDYLVCLPCRDRRRKLRLDPPSRSETHG